MPAALDMPLDRVIAMLLAPGPLRWQASAREALSRWEASMLDPALEALVGRVRAHSGGDFLPLVLDEDEDLAAVSMIAACRPMRAPSRMPRRACLIHSAVALGELGVLEIGFGGALAFHDSGVDGDGARLVPRLARQGASGDRGRWRARMTPTDRGYVLALDPPRGSPTAESLRQRDRDDDRARAGPPGSADRSALLAETGRVGGRTGLRLSCDTPEALLRLSALAQSRGLLVVEVPSKGPLAVVRLAPLAEEAVELPCLPVIGADTASPGVRLPGAPKVPLEPETALGWMRRHGVPEQVLASMLLEALFEPPGHCDEPAEAGGS